jgi:protein-S-isoprenylcysteine O-methyltransferase Ste14
MGDDVRREQARLRAEAYAPAPKDSWLLYVGIAVVLLFLGLVAVGGFYAIDVWQQPMVIVALAFVAAGAGLALRFRQSARHEEAHRNEFNRGRQTP